MLASPPDTDTMPTPSTTIYVRPTWGSTTWTYAGAAMPSGAASSAITAVSFDVSTALGQQLTRGQIQYSFDNGNTWNAYTAPVDGQGAFVAATGTMWRFLDSSSDGSSPNTFGVHYKLADGSVATGENTVIVDNAPVGVVGENHSLFSTAQTGAVADLLSPVDTGAATGGRWVIDSQSQSGLFSIAYDPATDTSARLVVADAAKLPGLGLSAAVTVHYYDRYELDTNGNPIGGQGVARTLVYTVEDGVTHDLPGFGNDLKVGPASNTVAANPSLAALTTGGFVAVWQANDTMAGGNGAGIWAQLRDASGAATGPAFALAPNGDANIESEPAVTALSGGRFAVAYSVIDGSTTRVAYRVVEANGSVGAEHVLDASAGLDAAMPTVATLADGSFAIGWRSGGTVHVQQAAADGSLAGAQQAYGALSSAYSPSLAALKQGGYMVSWGEINDGNVYAATSASGQAFVVNGDGYAASLSTAAPLPHMTTLANGNVVIAWDSYVNAPIGFAASDIFFQMFDSTGHALGGPVQANVDGGAGRFDAAVTALSDGGFVLAWQSQDGDYDGSGIFGRRFAADGSAVDAQEFEVNQMRAGDQTSPDLVALAKGGFAAAWVDSQGGSATIEARVYTSPEGAQDANSGNVGITPPAPSQPVPAPVTVNGTPGIDTAHFGGQLSQYTLQSEGAGFSVLDTLSGGKTVLSNVERLQFSDQSVALDIGGHAGEAYRLYQAAFNRTPDKVGLGYWINTLDKGNSLQGVADGFIHSAEFDSMVGANASDAQYVAALYQNVLHRAPDASGYEFWLHALTIAPRAEVLVNFSESPENQAQVIGAIANGIGFTPWTAG